MLRVAENLPAMNFQSSAQKLPSRTAAPSTDRILVVEDDRAVQRALRRLFEAEGYTVQTADDGASAIELFRSLSPSAVVLDLASSGNVRARRLQRDQRTCRDRPNYCVERCQRRLG